jgi:hypothetical protein
VSANLHTLRLAGAVLCATASLLLLGGSLYMFTGEGTSLGAVLLLLVGLGLLAAAVKSFKASELG